MMLLGMPISEITMGSEVSKDIHCDVTMHNDLAMCTCGITMHNDVAMCTCGITMHNDVATNLFYYVL